MLTVLCRLYQQLDGIAISSRFGKGLRLGQIGFLLHESVGDQCPMPLDSITSKPPEIDLADIVEVVGRKSVSSINVPGDGSKMPGAILEKAIRPAVFVRVEQPFARGGDDWRVSAALVAPTA